MISSDLRPSRRAFLNAAALAAVAAPASSEMLTVDRRQLVSRGDLVYDKPASRSEEGIPIGNGRMGTLVWTSPDALRMQINRVDVYPISSAGNSFVERNNDYCGGCGFVDIHFGGDVFPEAGFPQRLSIYDGLLTIQGAAVASRVLASPAHDVMAIAIDDKRRGAERVQVALRMLRYDNKHFGSELESFARSNINAVRTGSHVAKSQLAVQGEHVVLTQDFREGKHCCKSAVAIGIIGRGVKARIANSAEARVAAATGAGSFTVLIASAATFDPAEDIAASALRQLEAASAKGYPALAAETSAWWHDFWSKSLVHLHSADGVADYVESNYSYYQYVMGSASRGKFPPKFNGMIWSTAGDLRTWGAQHWYANTSCYYEAIPSTNRYELMDPFFDMYFGAHEACSIAARQQWGSQGSYIPETMYFDGLERMPDDIAAEMRELYLLSKPWDKRSARFIEYSKLKHPHSSRWNWIGKREWVDGSLVDTERGFGPYGNVNHIFGTSAKVPYLFWRRYEYTLDREWLTSRAYPMLKGAAEFYRNYPNLVKGEDGKYHIHHVNSNESVYGARDTDEDIASMRGVLAACIRASEILGQDVDLRARWSELLANLPPLPTSDHPESLRAPDYKGPTVFVRGLKPAVKQGGMLPDGNSMPAWLFDLCNLENPDKRTLEVANETLSASYREKPGPATPVGLLSKIPMAAATLGRADEVRYLVPNQMRGLLGPRGTPGRTTANMANRMSLQEGAQATDAQALGRASEALHLALLQSNPPGPAEPPVIRVFPAWPQDWDAEFTLLARGAFLVTSSWHNKQVEFVEIESRAGAGCRLRNPWSTSDVTFYRDRKKSETVRGSLLQFATRTGEKIVILPAGQSPEAYRRKVRA